MHERQGRTTWVLVDGENIDATLGTSILDRRPRPEERPRWDRLSTFAAERWQQPAQGVFFLNATSGMPLTFVQALKSLHYVVVPLSGSSDQKVVDIAIERTLRALREREADVMLVSNDGDFADDLAALVDGERRVGVVGFSEFRSGALSIPGVELLDLEHDARVFDSPLPRLRVIPIDEFDPAAFLG